MILTYTPDDGNAVKWVFRPDDMLDRESEEIERRTDWTWPEFLEKLQKQSTLARRVLLWVLLRRQHPTLRFEDLSFRQSQCVLEFDRTELESMRSEIEKSPDRPGVDRALILDVLAREIEKAPDVNTLGKAIGGSGA